MKQLLSSCAKRFFPVLFIGYISCISFFEHSHMVDGVVVIHSHPFDKSTHHDHQQNKTDIYFIQSLSTVSATDGVICTVCLDYHALTINTLYKHNDPEKPRYLIRGKSFLRPPPIV